MTLCQPQMEAATQCTQTHFPEITTSTPTHRLQPWRNAGNTSSSTVGMIMTSPVGALQQLGALHMGGEETKLLTSNLLDQPTHYKGSLASSTVSSRCFYNPFGKGNPHRRSNPLKDSDQGEGIGLAQGTAFYKAGRHRPLQQQESKELCIYRRHPWNFMPETRMRGLKNRWKLDIRQSL